LEVFEPRAELRRKPAGKSNPFAAGMLQYCELLAKSQVLKQ
jgi:hypothetical protein